MKVIARYSSHPLPPLHLDNSPNTLGARIFQQRHKSTLYRTATCIVACAVMQAGFLHAQTNLEIWFDSNRSGTTQIWKMNPDGSGLQQITTNSVDTYGPVPSHDGTRIAYYMQHGNGYDVRVMNADGSNDTLVRTFAQSNGWVGVDTWLPNDSQLVLNSFYYNTGIGQAFTLSLDGSTQSVFIDSAINSNVNAV